MIKTCMSSVFLNEGEIFPPPLYHLRDNLDFAEKACRVTTFRRAFSTYVFCMEVVGVQAPNILYKHPLGGEVVSLFTS